MRCGGQEPELGASAPPALELSCAQPGDSLASVSLHLADSLSPQGPRRPALLCAEFWAGGPQHRQFCWASLPLPAPSAGRRCGLLSACRCQGVGEWGGLLRAQGGGGQGWFSEVSGPSGRAGQAEARGGVQAVFPSLSPAGCQAEGQADPDGGVASGVRLWKPLGANGRSSGRGPSGGHLPGPPAARYSGRREARGALAGRTPPSEPFGWSQLALRGPCSAPGGPTCWESGSSLPAEVGPSQDAVLASHDLPASPWPRRAV